MSTIPNPSIMQRFAPKKVEQPTPVVVADIEPTDPGRIVRPGQREVAEYVEHDGVVKAKHLKPGQKVRAWLHGAPRGGEHEVKTVEKIEDGATYLVTFVDDTRPPTEYKAAYRFHDASLIGTTVRRTKRVPALVAYEEV